MRFWKNKPLAYLSTLLAGIGIGSCAVQKATVDRPKEPAGVPLLSAAQAAPGYEASREPIVKAVQQTAPAVVTIDTTAQQRRLVFDNQEDYFFGRGGRQETREVPRGSGSGVLLAGGYVLTNEHVVGDSVQSDGRIRITLANGKKYLATAVGADRATDVALLKVQNAGELPVAPMGADDTLLPGQTVIAIGSPVGLSASVSAGVVSALGRPLMLEDRMYENLIQTDTAINPGNSGGALIDLGGRVVGINTLVRRDAQNIGFAIPIRTALRVADELKRYGKIRRPDTGIIPLELDPRLRRYLELPESVRGIVVRAVRPNSPAAQAKLASGDVITQIADQPIPDVAGYRQALNGMKIGQTVEVTIIRGDQQGKVRIALAEAP
jgi:serine protease Do